MTICKSKSLQFPALNGKKIVAEFSGGNVSSDGGILLLQAMDRRLSLTQRIARHIKDSRSPDSIRHTMLSMLRQRVYGLACGYEDNNDHDQLRYDLLFQTASGSEKVLASSPTLHRFEKVADRELAVVAHKEMIETFITSFSKAPKQLILDFDATDDLVHGNQEGRFYHGYYGNYCFLPLYVFCDKQLLVSYLRPSKIDGARHAWAILALLVCRFRQEWPNVKIIFRGDSGFCRQKMLTWCERHGVDYIIGIARNKVLEKALEKSLNTAKEHRDASQKSARVFESLMYQAGSWKTERRVIGKAEYTLFGSNPRFIVTTLKGNPRTLYEEMYCARGEMENRIKEQQGDLFSDRTSCTKWWPNQWRLILSSLAYILIERIRKIGLRRTSLARATAGSIRLKLLKIGTVILRNTRRISLRMASGYPHQNLFTLLVHRLAPS
ncbi:MAG: IS1380 family transposase [bacterium]